jgi:hypothetical protein
MGCLLLAQAQTPHSQADSRAASIPAPALVPSDSSAARIAVSPWFVILSGPQDLDELWRKVESPDLAMIKGDQLTGNGSREAAGGSGRESKAWWVESVKVRGLVAGDVARLTVELGIFVNGQEPLWVPIRLDDQKLTGARQGARDLSLRKAEEQGWQVKVTGAGEHQVQIDLRVPVNVDPARKSLSLAIPEAASTSVELDFSERVTDILVGRNENFGQKELPDGKGCRLSAQLEPRSKLDVSWTNTALTASVSPPLLTAHGEVAVDIDAEQMRIRSSWSIRCVRGATRSLEIGVDDQDEITELQLDDQVTESGTDWVREAGKVTIRLPDALRPGNQKRLAIKTRRLFPVAVARRISLAGFPLTYAREQSGAIGITHSANLWVGTTASQGLRRISPGDLPTDLRKRPSTNLAFEFLDQPFVLNLDIEASPPLVRAESRTYFQIDRQQAYSETTVDLDWVRGRLFEVEFGLSAGLELMSVGPSDVVDGSHLTTAIAPSNSAGGSDDDRRLKIGLTSQATSRNKVTIRLVGSQRIPLEGSVKLGLFAPVQTTSASATYALIAERSLALEPEGNSARLRRASDLKVPIQSASEAWRLVSARKEMSSPPLLLWDDGNSRYLSIRLTRLARTLEHDTALSAQVTARGTDVVERMALSVSHGTLDSVEVRVPAAIGERFELLETEKIERTELGRETDGSMRYRLSFDRPVVDKAALRFRYRIPHIPSLDPRTARELKIPWISLKDSVGSPVKVTLWLAPEIVVENPGPGWIRSPEDGRAESAGDALGIQFDQDESRRESRSFTFKARVLEPVALPQLVVPRLLIKTVERPDGSRRTTALYWVETHGPELPVALPRNARWIGARIDGRHAGGVDFDPTTSHYRLRFPGDVGSRPALVEIDYQETGQDAASNRSAPQLLDGGVVLQSLWELRLPWSKAVLGIPDGWSDENQWHWTGYVWKRRPWKNPASLNEWLLGAGVASSAIDDYGGSSSDDSDRYLFSQSGQPRALTAWIVPGSLLVAVCSGAALLVGFLVIFTKIRMRTIWLAVAGLSLLAAVYVEPGVTFVAIQSASIGVVLTILGLLIESLTDRWKSIPMFVRGRRAPPGPAAVDSSLKRAPIVGSDDSTAIRVTVPSTQDYVPAPIAVATGENEVRSRAVERA